MSKKSFVVADHFPEHVDVVAFCPDIDDESLLRVYRSWCEANAPRLAIAVEPDAASIELRQQWRADAPWVPLWSQEDGARALQGLADEFSVLVVPQSSFGADRPTEARVNRLVQRGDLHVHGLGVSKVELVSTVAFGSVSTGSWLGPSQRGETIVWDGRELRRFPQGQKDVRGRYRSEIAALDIDPAAVEADDSDALMLLAVRSWQRFEDHLTRHRNDADVGYPRVSDTPDGAQKHRRAVPWSEPSDTRALERGTKPVVQTRARVLLPTLSPVDENDMSAGVRIASAATRRCDTCNIASSCPSVSPGSTCAYEIPVRITSKEQLTGVFTAMVEMQAQRILFLRFAEETEGMGANKALSDELDRMTRMVHQMDELTDTRDVVKMSVEARGNAGVLSRLFGAQVGEAARALPEPLTAGETDAHLQRVIDV